MKRKLCEMGNEMAVYNLIPKFENLSVQYPIIKNYGEHQTY